MCNTLKGHPSHISPSVLRYFTFGRPIPDERYLLRGSKPYRPVSIVDKTPSDRMVVGTHRKILPRLDCR